MANEPSGLRGDGGTQGRRGARGEAHRPPPRRRRKARLVHRVVRHVEVWSVAKIATAFALCGYVIGMISGYLLWRAADRVGTIDGIEGFFEDSGGYEGGFEILGSVVFQATAVGMAVLCALFVALASLGAVLFNLISDLTGGIRMTAIDEDLIVTPARRPAGDAPARPPADEPTAASPADTNATTTNPPATAPAVAAPARDPWKMPTPDETWTTPTTGTGNGAAPTDESIGLGSADEVV
ncbi:DUF3566 domain-containing protein [Actinospongicola halichondriae]|uniref:DUF3566 domain-containing protein n=1 Tax=Actinospongicola halichondriae TaxID=3236844 RepID=UPI003D3B1F1F